MELFYNISDFDHVFQMVNNLKVQYLGSSLLTVSALWRQDGICSPFNRIYIITEGTGWLKVGNTVTALAPGHVYLIPAGLTYDYGCDDTLTQLYFHVKVQFFYGIDMFDGVDKILTFPIKDDAVQTLIENIKGGTLSDLFRVKSYLDGVIAALAEVGRLTLPANYHFKYLSLFRVINDHLTVNIKIEDIAKHFHQSAQTLSKNFKKDTGIGLKKQMEQMLASKAAELLIGTDATVKEIALQLGFSDQYYFSRFMKKHTGWPPREYRKKNSISAGIQ